MNGRSIPVLIFLLSFMSCQQDHKDQTEETGQIDPVAIAADTTAQKAIEGSYEYFKALPVSAKLAFDVITGGESRDSGEFFILRRKEDNRADTLARGTRIGRIINSWVCDLNGNQYPEVMFTSVGSDSDAGMRLTAYEYSSNDQLHLLDHLAQVMNRGTGFRGRDTIYVKEGKLIRSVPVFRESDQDCCPSGGEIVFEGVLQGKVIRESVFSKTNIKP